MSEETNTQAPELTAQQIELENLRLERLKLEERLNESQAQARAAEAEHKALKREQAIKNAVTLSGVKFYNSADVIQLVEQQYGISEDGLSTGDGKPLHETLQAFSLQNPSLADGRSLRSLRQNEEQKQRAKYPTSRAEFSTIEDKTRFITEFGIEAWEALPSYPPKALRITNFSEFCKAPMDAKVAYIAEHGAPPKR